MARTYREVGVYCCLVLLMLVNLGTCDLQKDKNECLNQLVGLSTCIPYVGGQAKMPTMDCCKGLTQVLKTSKKCLCILVRDRNDPSLGLKVNATLALGLPDKCKSPNGDVSECPALLHLAPNSPDAKVFTDFAKQGGGVGATSTDSSTPASGAKPSDSTSTTSAKGPSNGGAGKRWLIAQMFYGVLIWCFTFHFII